MEIYVVVETSIWDYEPCNDAVMVFKNLENAKKEFETRCKEAEEDIKNFTNTYMIDKTENCFSVYEKGDYTKTHCDVIIYKRYIQD